MERDLQQFKSDIIKACDQIAKDIEGYTFETFKQDHKTSNSVVVNLTVIGEAAGRFPEAVRERNPKIRWKSVVGLRNIITHEYFDIDLKKIWDTATVHVPELKKQVEDLNLD